jgi:hypothetical protein
MISADFRKKKSSNIKFHENPSSGANLLQADGRTDMTKLTVAFSQFCEKARKMHGKYTPLCALWEAILLQ